MQSLFILGRQPALGLAELESLYGPKAVTPVGGLAAIVDAEPDQVPFDNLGGATKYGRVLTVLGSVDWRDIDRHLRLSAAEMSQKDASKLSEGKLTIGISAYGLKVTPSAIQATGLSMKKSIKKSGRPVRLVPNNEPALNTAQVLHNGLTKPNGWELLLVRDGNRTILAQTVRVQDIESYTVRDRERPMRDSRVGMLPPKLAQLLINMAVGEQSHPTLRPLEYIEDIEQPHTEQQRVVTDHSDITILDPFCGTGVVLQEALLMRYQAYGSDIEPRMVDYSWQNIKWLSKSFELGDYVADIEVGDATTYKWAKPFSHVASETYLGRPFTATPSPEILSKTVSECNLIIKKFLRNIHGQLPEGARLCLAVPAWQTRPGYFKHLPLLETGAGSAGKNSAKNKGGAIDQIADMGYNRISFEHVRDEDLMYYREDQIVARQLLIISKQSPPAPGAAPIIKKAAKPKALKA